VLPTRPSALEMTVQFGWDEGRSWRTNSINLRRNLLSEITTQPSLSKIHYLFLSPEFSLTFSLSQKIFWASRTFRLIDSFVLAETRFDIVARAAWTGSWSWIRRLQTWIPTTSLRVCWFSSSISRLNRSLSLRISTSNYSLTIIWIFRPIMESRNKRSPQLTRG